MSTYLVGEALEEKLTDIIWHAKKHVIVLSPFIKLDPHTIKIFDKIKVLHEIQLILVFGKNEDDPQRSLSSADFNYFKEFKNIAILHHKDLHAKYYANEKEGLVTSLNLYDYSMRNNIEYGIHFTKSLLNPTNTLYQDTQARTEQLIYEESHLIYLRKPQYKRKMLGLTKAFQDAPVLFDVSVDFFAGLTYRIENLKNFDLDVLSDVEKAYESKPQRETTVASTYEPKYGYCIRTGNQIPYDPSKPLSYPAYQTWQQFGNRDYPENYCYKTGKESGGRTSVGRPVL